MNVDSVTNDLGMRLRTSTVVTIPPHNIAIMPLEPSLRALQSNGVNTELIKVIGKSIDKHRTAISVNIMHATQI